MRQMILHIITTVGCIFFDYTLLTVAAKFAEANNSPWWFLLLLFLMIPKAPDTVVKQYTFGKTEGQNE